MSSSVTLLNLSYCPRSPRSGQDSLENSAGKPSSPGAFLLDIYRTFTEVPLTVQPQRLVTPLTFIF